MAADVANPLDREASTERVRAVLEVAGRLADAASALGREARDAVLASSGLSPEGVDFALGEHIETDVSPHDLEHLLAWVHAAPRCHVVLSAHVCVAPVRATALAAATAPRVVLKPSRRDPALAILLARELGAHGGFRRAGGTVALAEALEAEPGDEVHAYGSDATLDAIARALSPGVVFRAHGTGFGVAFVAEADALGDAHALARDVVAFDQRGCLSPRIVVALGTERRGRAAAAAVHEALAEMGERVPRGPLGAAARAEVASFRSVAEGLGDVFASGDHLVAFFPATIPAPLPPAARTVSVVAARDTAAAKALLAPYLAHITTVGGSPVGHDAARPWLLSPGTGGASRGPRAAALGRMQRPPLDGPVDLRPWR